MNHSNTVSTKPVCPMRKSTRVQLTMRNMKNMSMSTAAKLPSKAIKVSKLPRRKVLKIAHVNLCSLRNKVNEINNLLVTDDILTISETNLDNTFDDTVVAIQCYNIYRKDRNASGGGVSVYIQNHIPVKIREDLMLNTVEVIWLQVHLPHLNPILVGGCYRPPSANSQYLDNMCEMLDNACDINREVYFLGDLNIDWLSSSCPLKKKLQTVTSGCNLIQVISQHTRVVKNSTGMKSLTCIDHIFTNPADICLKAVSRSIGCSDHNIISISRKTKVPTAGPNIMYRRSYNTFCSDSYVVDVNNMCWSMVCNEEQTDLIHL